MNTSTGTTGTSTSQRLHSLDGLRGVAAIVVVAYHSLLISPTMSEIIMGNKPPRPGSLPELLLTTPLRIFVAGNEAVLVFFVLSGLVLTLQVARQRDFDWGAYFPRRLVRLYVPALASLVLAIAIQLLTHRDRGATSSAWVGFYTYPDFEWKMVLQAADLFSGTPDFNSPLWSLRWELLFSLLLPIFVIIETRGRASAWTSLAAAPVLMWVGLENGVMPLVYLPAFMVGVALASLLRGGHGLAPSLRPTWRSHLGWAIAAVAALFLLIAHWLTTATLAGQPGLIDAMSVLVLVGAGGVVVVAARWSAAVWLLSSPPIAWLGRISFSLYLVHVPILIGTANLLHFLPSPVVILIAIAFSVAIAELFTRFVEVPSIALSKRAGRQRPMGQPTEAAAATPR